MIESFQCGLNVLCTNGIKYFAGNRDPVLSSIDGKYFTFGSYVPKSGFNVTSCFGLNDDLDTH